MLINSLVGIVASAEFLEFVLVCPGAHSANIELKVVRSEFELRGKHKHSKLRLNQTNAQVGLTSL